MTTINIENFLNTDGTWGPETEACISIAILDKVISGGPLKIQIVATPAAAAHAVDWCRMHSFESARLFMSADELNNDSFIMYAELQD